MGTPKTEQLIFLKSSDLARDVLGFLVDRQARGLSPRTVNFYRDELANLVRFLKEQGILETQAVCAAHLRAFLLNLAERRNGGGVHAGYRAVRAFFRWYEGEYEPSGWTNPIHKVSAPKVAQEVLPPANLADVKAMLDTCKRRTFTGDRDRAILLGLPDTGTRAQESCGLDIDDVDTRTGAVRIREGKGGKTRVAFLGAKARRALTEYLRHRDEGGPLWVTTR